ncbi:filamentous hemagglutinin family n-terminal domain protein [Leptolyngbya sp. Heron Island J]|uniref:CHAT domain-containing protein n=1 Tax=Leptolyngbya sp. Heron Island J TaxID=1385935 RepID=UPI0003B9B8E1|nr:CHAT domain-containing protein [Leptolyngbya sp. Heron Island J]ESA37604.1 filamentous hemagglutinin family n-terminal domain protein [Leptolyngbya sp. Heron Island J]
MDVLTKATVVFTLLPLIGSGITDTALAQPIVPRDQTTQVNVSDNGLINISGGTQSAGNLFHRFEQFNLNQQETANFITSSNTHTVLSEIIGGTASNIDGLLQITGSNADLYLVNPAGLIFGPHARLNLNGSFTATTATHLGTPHQWLDLLSDADYSTLVTPPSHFGFSRPATIVNHGQLTVRAGESLRLLAPQVINTGTLNAPEGEITLFAPDPGQTIRLEQVDGLLSLEISTDAEVTDTLPALMTGGNLSHSNELVVSNDGEVNLVYRDITSEHQPSFSLQNTGNLSTQGITGGEINLLGHSIQVLDSTLNASGTTAGGIIRIGGDFHGEGGLPHATQISITGETTLLADTIEGDGGQVAVWSDHTTIFDGQISAQSATGNGGLVETSGLHELIIGDNATVTTTAEQGIAGLWLIDPMELSVVDAGVGSIDTDTNDAFSSSISAATIVAALDNTNVTLQSTHSITINTAIDASQNSAQNNLFLDTDSLNLNEYITLKGSGQLSGSANTVYIGENGSIQNGIDAVAHGGTVTLAETIYREGNTITIDHPLTLMGQGQERTYISGDIDNSGTGNHRVFEITSQGNNVNLLGLTIQDGLSISEGAGLRNFGDTVAISDVRFTNNESTGSTRDGGAVHNKGSLTLSDTIFDHNRTSSNGGAIDIAEGSAIVVDSMFTNNQSGDNAGAINVASSGTLHLSNSEFSSNIAGANGGAIFSAGALTIGTANFTSNRAAHTGGAIFLSDDSEIRASHFLDNMAKRGGGLYNQGDLTLLQSTVANNQATGTDTYDGGGGILNYTGGHIVIDSTLISNNLSANSGGGILNLATDAHTEIAIANSSIVSNQAATLGGGIEVAGILGFENLSQLNVTNSTVSSNQAITGAGIRTVGPTTLINTTIANNMATSSGGGISDNVITATSPALINTLVANNSAPINPDVEGHFVDQGHNLVGINQGSTGFTLSPLIGTNSRPLDPKLTALNNQLGSLPSHQLLHNSPAANTGDNSVASPSDQHGRSRIIGNIIDIGAVESNILPAVRPTSSNSPTPASQPSPSPLPQHLQGDAPTMPLIHLNNGHISIQENTKQPLDLEATSPRHISTTTRRVHSFDQEAFQSLENSFSQDYQEYWQLPQTQPMTLQSIQQTLHQANQQYQTESAIIYAIFVPKSPIRDDIKGSILPRTQYTPNSEDQLLLILVSANGEPIQQLVDVSRTELTQQAKLFRLAVSDPADPVSYKALARQMYGWLLAPLQQDLAQKQIEHVIYSLDQGLRTIPLAAMMQAETFLIEQYGVSLIPSMGLTQPQFDRSDANLRALVAGANQFRNFEYLPAVPLELDIVAQSTGASNILLNETFTLDNFLDLQTSQQPKLLHLATHAEFNAGSLDRSFIQFWDEPLTFHQMRALSWSELELLILSACGTALSSPEAELGFTGLAAAAGIETAIGSLWNVSDVGTLALMAEFYSQLPKTILRSTSLQKAQLSLIQGETHINKNVLTTSQGTLQLAAEWDLPKAADFSHPFYWAGFTLVGNPWQ